MKKVGILSSFERSAKRLDSLEKEKLEKSLEQLNHFLVTGQSSHGFRFKKIDGEIYEFRVDIRLRVIVKFENGIYYLALLGNHDEIRRYLKDY